MRAHKVASLLGRQELPQTESNRIPKYISLVVGSSGLSQVTCILSLAAKAWKMIKCENFQSGQQRGSHLDRSDVRTLGAVFFSPFQGCSEGLKDHTGHKAVLGHGFQVPLAMKPKAQEAEVSEVVWQQAES